MARLDDIDIDIRNAVLRANATDREEIARILRYLYRLSGKLKWWQTKLDRGNLTEEERKVYEGLITGEEEIRQELAGKADRAELDALEVGGRNLLLNSADPAIHASGSSTFTVTKNQSVSAWNANTAIRVAGTGGSSMNVFYVGGTSADIAYNSSISLSGQKYAFGVYVKNNHATNYIGVRTNPYGNISEFFVAPGTGRFITNTATGNGSSVLQIVFRVQNIGDSFDVTFWHPKIELGTFATDWTPAVEDYAGKTSVTFSSIRNTTNTTSNAGGTVRKVGKTVLLNFSAVLSAALSAGTWVVVGTLPSGYRPPEDVMSFSVCTTDTNPVYLRGYIAASTGSISVKTATALATGKQVAGSVTFFV